MGITANPLRLISAANAAARGETRPAEARKAGRRSISANSFATWETKLSMARSVHTRSAKLLHLRWPRPRFLAARLALVVVRPALLIVIANVVGGDEAGRFGRLLVAAGVGMVISAFDSGKAFYRATAGASGRRRLREFNAYTGRLAWRHAHTHRTPTDQARLSTLDRDGAALSALHALTWRPTPSAPPLTICYEWLDPQTDFAYNTRHALSLSARLPLLTRAPWTLEATARYAHLWSSDQDRLSADSDLTTLSLTWRPMIGER